jgi:hypothetical protein
MKATALLAIATMSLALPSCASNGHGMRSLASLDDYDAYYDDAYGPFYDGYWGDDGAFYHREHPGQPFAPDNGGHFHHSGGGGFHGVHTGGGAHGGGGRR